MPLDGDAVRDVRREVHGDFSAAIVCTQCGHSLTTQRAAVEVAGRHMHRHMNPAGILFVTRCFWPAPGVMVQGEGTAQHSWFPPSQWRYAHCGGCRGHLGWSFDDDGAAPFVALVDERICEAAA